MTSPSYLRRQRIRNSIFDAPSPFSTAQLLSIALLCLSAFLRALPHYVSAFPIQSPDATNSSDRSNAFQVLADGTQDLAALIGLFATDSVERYTVDHTRGYLGVAMSMCSLLGILGYARALVKLALGLDSCNNSGFPTNTVRPILGVAKADRIATPELAIIYHVAKKRSMVTVQGRDISHVEYVIADLVAHTEESFPGAWVEPSIHPGIRYKKIAPGWWKLHNRDYGLTFRGDWTILARGWVCLVLSAGVTSFSTLWFIRNGPWTWTRYFSTIGLFIGLITSSVMWSYVFARQQMPNDIRNAQLSKLSQFACWRFPRIPSVRIIADLKPLTGSPLTICRAISGCCAVIVVIGYVCQYIEVRKSTRNEAAIWLAVQVGLAIIRLLVWIVDPSFDEYNSFELSNPPQTTPQDQRMEGYELAMTQLLVGVAPSTGTDSRDIERVQILRMPSALEARLSSIPVKELLEGSLTIARRGLPEALRKTLLEDCTPTWTLGVPFLFRRWLAIRSGSFNEETYIDHGMDPLDPNPWDFTCIFANPFGDPANPWAAGDVVMIPVLDDCRAGDVGGRPTLHNAETRYAVAEPDSTPVAERLEYDEGKRWSVSTRGPWETGWSTSAGIPGPQGEQFRREMYKKTCNVLADELKKALDGLQNFGINAPAIKDQPAVNQGNPSVIQQQPPIAVQGQPLVFQGQPSAVWGWPPAAVAVPGHPSVIQGQPPSFQGQPPVIWGQPPGFQGQPPFIWGQPPVIQAQSPGFQGQPSVIVGWPPAAVAVQGQSPGIQGQSPVIQEHSHVAGQGQPPVIQGPPHVAGQGQPPVIQRQPKVAVQGEPPVTQGQPQVAVQGQQQVIHGQSSVTQRSPSVTQGQPAVPAS